ncbi:hypothetical protein Q6348_08095 [Isoptericola sp. b441]|uniref:Uncharacterized protein n=1 Tax=Actinotalea lenta TaxID=3064654 RepID=A0ABT9DCW1_9CELL|nr:hypothetical protein [Isoptericola sp. b441]MDO8107156.1 hypothetical protein [Isoptericola sp. b441]
MGFRNPVTSLRADQITPGTLQPGVTLPAAQVSDGTLGLGVVAAALADGTVTPAALADAAVTTAKLAAGSVTSPAMAAGAILADAIAAGAVTDAAIADAAVKAVALAGGAVTGDKIAAGAVTATAIAAGAILAGKLAAGAVTADKIAAGAVTATAIGADAVYAGAIAAGAVGAAEIAAGAITAAKIAAGAITADKIAAGAIDGTTITGAIIRTAATGQRVQLGNDSDRIDFYSDAGQTSETSPGYLRIGEDWSAGPARPIVELATPEVSGVADTVSRLTGYGGNGFTNPTWTLDAPLAAPNLTAGLEDPPVVRVHKSTSVVWSTSTWQYMAWDVADENPDSMFSPATSVSAIFCRYSGLYHLSVTAAFLGSGNRYLAYSVNDGARKRLCNSDTTDPELSGTDLVRMTAGQYLRLLAYSSSGGTMNAIDGSPRVSMVWVRR